MRLGWLSLLASLGCGPAPARAFPEVPAVDAGPCALAVDGGCISCSDVPILSYENFGQGFLNENCQACHALRSNDRHGAPIDVNFDSRDAVHRLAARILDRAAGRAPSMPPGGGVVDEQRTNIEIWLRCFPP